MGTDAGLGSLSPLVVRLHPIVELSDADFFQLCLDNRDLRLERSARGDVLIMPPTGGETGRRSMRIAGQLDRWAEQDGTGVAFDSSTGFVLPSGAIRSPDAAWVLRSRWDALAPEGREGFVRLAPDFLIELRSPSDRLDDLQAKMVEFVAAGVRLAWLIDPVDGRVHVYAPPSAAAALDRPARLSADPVLPGFVLDLEPLW
jgi:Uma2 family endonuclease